MSAITGNEPSHWHHKDGEGRCQHNMNDPRRIGGPEAHWSDDEKAYAAHLTQHEMLAASITPLEDDDPFVRSVLEYLATEAQIVEKSRVLAVLLRRELAEGTPLKEAKAAHALKRILSSRSPAVDVVAAAAGEETT